MRRTALLLVLGLVGLMLAGCTWTRHLPEDMDKVRAGVENWRTDTYGNRTPEY